ncbi:phosphatase PAP2 family protein [Streptomyces sp. NPDC020807]|uniref:phosphatase PAP2 family protein n=1 Tax=Streptomyces sp. NPDC020807 TaxID=3155119 RepID=UPI0033ED034F
MTGQEDRDGAELRRAWLAPVALLAACAVGVMALRYGGTGEPGRVDARIQGLVDGLPGSWWPVATAVDALGEREGAAVLVLSVVALCLVLRRPRAAVLIVAACGTSVAATMLLKPLVGRTIHGGSLAYPSGHTAFLTAFILVLALLVTGRFGLVGPGGAVVVLLASLVAGVAMGWAQVATNSHYPTDTIGGYFTALAVVTATAWLVDRRNLLACR